MQFIDGFFYQKLLMIIVQLTDMQLLKKDSFTPVSKRSGKQTLTIKLNIDKGMRKNPVKGGICSTDPTGLKGVEEDGTERDCMGFEEGRIGLDYTGLRGNRIRGGLLDLREEKGTTGSWSNLEWKGHGGIRRNNIRKEERFS